MTRQEYAKITPETVATGDTIEVVLPAENGVTVRRRGVVGGRETYSSGIRKLYTPEGGELYRWMPGNARGAIFRIARAAAHNPEPMFDLESLVENA